MKKRDSYVFQQGIPLVLTFVIFVVLCLFVWAEILVLNLFSASDILIQIRWADVLVGMTIYLKTSVDFAIFIGNLMAGYPGMKNRIAIEIGTAVGNALGTVIILAIWNFFREIDWLLALMILIAAFVLLRLAEEGLEHAEIGEKKSSQWLQRSVHIVGKILSPINHYASFVLKYVIPSMSMKPKSHLSFWGLFVASFTVPFILGLDDFAGYVPVFNIVNVFGFSVGVLAGHMILNIFLFISPKKTITIVKNPIISFLGSLAFIALAVWGFYEVFKILLLH